MKKLQILFFVMLFSGLAFAAPGDTTWVTVFQDRKIDHYGNFDTTAVLPNTNTTYRKIRMHYILGRYACEPGAQYCGSWDYTTMVIAKPANTDPIEIGRIITPYATDWLATNRKHDYVVDVTDYATVLKNALDMTYKYEGYSWGFTLTLKFEFIEGTPPQNALSVQNIYDGYFAYGKTSDPVEDHLITKNYTFQAPGVVSKVKNTISGHGSDDTQCSEFCSKYYRMFENNNLLEQVQLWKSDCGLNHVYPQTGTWLYDRANWCPGEQVYPIYHTLQTQAGTSFSVNMDLEPYTAPNQSNASGGFNIVSQLITYGQANFTRDISIEDILAPTSNENYFRFNPVCNNPMIKVKNTGSSAVTSLKIQFGLEGGTTKTFNWTGNLSFLEETVIDLGESFSLFADNNSNQFLVEILEVNGQNSDENLWNNTYRSKFGAVKSYPSDFVVYFKTNNALNPSNPSVNATSWVIRNATGEIVASRTDNANNTLYRDTLDLPIGCYTFEANDADCDGISWWVYPYYNPNPGTGILRFQRQTGPVIKNFNGDFGCQVKERFTVGYLLDTDENSPIETFVDVFPNPANEQLTIAVSSNETQQLQAELVDMSGKTVKRITWNHQNASEEVVSIDELKAGVYYVKISSPTGFIQTKKFIKQ